MLKRSVRMVAGDPHLEWWGTYHFVWVFVEVWRWYERDVGYRWEWSVKKSVDDNGVRRAFVGASNDEDLLDRPEAIRQAFECLRREVLG